jgi:hypothetical protein
MITCQRLTEFVKRNGPVSIRDAELMGHFLFRAPFWPDRKSYSITAEDDLIPYPLNFFDRMLSGGVNIDDPRHPKHTKYKAWEKACAECAKTVRCGKGWHCNQTACHLSH